MDKIDLDDYQNLFKKILEFSNNHLDLFKENEPLLFYYHAINNKQNFQLRLCRQGNEVVYSFKGARYPSGEDIENIANEFKESGESPFIIVKNFRESLMRSFGNDLSDKELVSLDKLLG